MPDPQEHPRPFYYLEHIEEVLREILKRYPSYLDDAERGFVEAFLALPQKARGLYARFLNRRGIVFREEKLRYPELEPVPDAVAVLALGGWIHSAATVLDEMPEEVLSCFTLTELRRAFPVIRPRRRADWDEAFLAEPSAVERLRAILNDHPCWFQEHRATWEALRVLYFGNRYESTEQFVIHELGHVQVEAREGAAFVPTFATPEGWRETLRLYGWRDALADVLAEEENDVNLCRWIDGWLDAYPWHAEAKARMERTALKAAKACEQRGWGEEALALYEAVEAPPARERRVRLLTKAGDAEGARALAEAMRDDPRSPEEAEFSFDVLRSKPRSGRRVLRATALQNDAACLWLPATWRGRVEAGVVSWFRSQGFAAVHGENGPWRQIAGLLCWEVFNGGHHVGFNHPLQRHASEAFDAGLYAAHQERFDACLAVLDRPAEALRQMQSLEAEKKGVSGTWVRWEAGRQRAAKALVERVSPEALRSVLIHMLRHPGAHGRGFPDLLVWRGAEVRLIEVKGPGDHLRPGQVQWVLRLREAGIATEVLRVEWMDKTGGDAVQSFA